MSTSAAVDRRSRERRQNAQPIAVTIAIIANLVLWGYPIPVGVGTLAPNVVITIISGLAIRGACYRNTSKPFVLALATVVYGCCIVPFSPFAPNVPKLVLSAGLFVCCGFALKRLADRVNLSVPLLSPQAAWACIAFVIASLVVHCTIRLLIGAVYEGPLRASGVYSEPSHLALSVVPLIFYLFRVASGAAKLAAGAVAMVILVLSSSFTFVLLLGALFLSWLLASIKVPRLMCVLLSRIPAVAIVSRGVQATGVLIIGFVLAVCFSASALGGHSLERAVGVFEGGRSDGSELGNLSSAVYLNGWLDMTEYLRSTHGLGVGFNQMGATGRPDTWITRMLSLAGLGDQNATEGSFILSKLGSEFGVLGIFVWLTFLLATVTVCRRALRPRGNVDHRNLVLMFATLAIISVGGVIRSTPYFSGPFVLALLCMYLTSAWSYAPTSRGVCGKSIDSRVRATLSEN